ncbi:MAG: hypothetical protein BZY82_02800 [SAR202 cluster bacterium Io17-Chloro-G3]|nr:MAG: hypothetical protein BZY82_02800 [SAR202 cluster bacterium Io17-Chloro-G3]
MVDTESKLTDEVRAVIGAEGEFVEASWWVVEKEGLRRFSQALMDPDPRFWDDEFAKASKYGEITTPAIYCSYLDRAHPSQEDPVTRAFKENPGSDGIGGVRGGRGSLPNVPTDLVRILNAGNEIEVYQYPSIGDRIYSQGRYSGITEREGRDGSRMLIVTAETRYYNQRGDLLSITRSSTIRR